MKKEKDSKPMKNSSVPDEKCEPTSLEVYGAPISLPDSVYPNPLDKSQSQQNLRDDGKSAVSSVSESKKEASAALSAQILADLAVVQRGLMVEEADTAASMVCGMICYNWFCCLFDMSLCIKDNQVLKLLAASKIRQVRDIDVVWCGMNILQQFYLVVYLHVVLLSIYYIA